MLYAFASNNLFASLSIDKKRDYHGINSKRLAEVWMDDYKRMFYMQRKNLRVCIYIFKVVNNVLNTDIYILNHLFIYLLFIFLTHHIIISTLHCCQTQL